MAERQITVTVPDEMFEPFRRHAEQEQQSIEEAVVSAIEAAIQPDRDQASGWRAALNALAWLDTPTLWQIVQRGAETEEVLLIRALHDQHQQAVPPPGVAEVTNAL